LHSDALVLANDLSKVYFESPEIWQFRTDYIDSLVQNVLNNSDRLIRVGIFDQEGNNIASIGQVPQHDWATIQLSEGFGDQFNAIGYVRVTEDIVGLYGTTTTVLSVGLLIGLAVFFFLWQYPMHALLSAQSKITEALLAAEGANVAKSEFMATMSHELRTPLTSINGSMRLLNGMMNADLTNDQKNLFDISLRNVDAMLLLINELLDYEKIISGTMKFDTRKHDIGELTLNVVKENQGYANEQSVKFEFDKPANILVSEVNDHRFNQVLRNVLSNAAKFSDPGDTVKISVSRDNVSVVVSVEDEGPGITEEDKQKIFEPFTQIDSSASRKYAGTGLGLSISKSLTDAMGGRLYCDTKVGVGSVFYICFPASN